MTDKHSIPRCSWCGGHKEAMRDAVMTPQSGIRLVVDGDFIDVQHLKGYLCDACLHAMVDLKPYRGYVDFGFCKPVKDEITDEEFLNKIALLKLAQDCVVVHNVGIKLKDYYVTFGGA